MRKPTPFAAWLSTFLATDGARLLHLGRSPFRQRPLMAARRWRKVYPFVAARDPRQSAEMMRLLRAESAHLRYTPWLLDPDVRLALATAALDYLTTQLPLAPGDLNLPVVVSRLIDQLAEAVGRRIESATPADLIAVHVLIRRLRAMSREPWAEAVDYFIEHPLQARS